MRSPSVSLVTDGLVVALSGCLANWAVEKKTPPLNVDQTMVQIIEVQHSLV